MTTCELVIIWCLREFDNNKTTTIPLKHPDLNLSKRSPLMGQTSDSNSQHMSKTGSSQWRLAVFPSVSKGIPFDLSDSEKKEKLGGGTYRLVAVSMNTLNTYHINTFIQSHSLATSEKKSTSCPKNSSKGSQHPVAVSLLWCSNKHSYLQPSSIWMIVKNQIGLR